MKLWTLHEMQESRLISFALVAPALAILLALFVYPLGFSLVTAFVDEEGVWTVGNFGKAFEFYSRDILFTIVIVSLSTVLIGLGAVAIGGFLTRAKTRARSPCCAGSTAGRCSSRSSSPAS